MSILGLVTEYNPFHNGHLYHLQFSKKRTAPNVTIAIMSGHFLQRGLPALLDKWTRAEMAIDAGVDLVIELPHLYACASAEYFASGSIALLGHCKATHICFGSESGSLEELDQAAQILAHESAPFKTALKKALALGYSFPHARAIALSQSMPQSNIHLDSPNTILGLEYLKAIHLQNVPITPLTLKRHQAEYHSKNLNGHICSATAIRHALFNERADIKSLESFMPHSSFSLLSNCWDEGRYVDIERFADILLYKLRLLSTEDYHHFADADPGIWNRLLEAAKTPHSIESLIQTVKTRRYTHTRIQRVLMSVLLDIAPDTKKRLGLPNYLRVLGANASGQKYLKKLKKESNIPIVTNLSRFNCTDPHIKEMLSYDIKATDIYTLGYSNALFRHAGQDWLRKMPVIK